jgi:hypothetical protein
MWAAFGFDAAGELLQPRTQHLVIVAATCIKRNRRLARRCQPLRFAFAPVVRQFARQVIHARHQHPDGARHQFRRPRALAAMRCHIIHLAMEARVQPLPKPRFHLRQVGICNAQVGKAELRGPCLDSQCEGAEVGAAWPAAVAAAVIRGANVLHDKYPFRSADDCALVPALGDSSHFTGCVAQSASGKDNDPQGMQ